MTLDKGKNNVKIDRFQVNKKLFFSLEHSIESIEFY